MWAIIFDFFARSMILVCSYFQKSSISDKHLVS